jgi:hypothetical protein
MKLFRNAQARLKIIGRYAQSGGSRDGQIADFSKKYPFGLPDFQGLVDNKHETGRLRRSLEKKEYLP